MAASPLAAALLGGEGGAGMMGMDPAIMAAQPDLQLGTSMIQQGLSTAPASPWAALARVAQAGAGTYLQHNAISDLAKAYAHSADNAAATLPEGHPLRAALASPDPVIRMQGLQAYQKALTLMSEGTNLPAGENRYFGKAVVSSNTGPQSPEGKAIQDASTLAAGGNPAAANAITSKISKEGQIGETGVAAPSVPLNGPRFQLGPVSRPPGPAPTSVPTSNMQPAVPEPTPDQMSAAKQKLGQKLQTVADAGITNPSATGMTSLPETIAAAKGTQQASEKLYGGASEALGKSIGEVIEGGGKNARDRINALNTIDDALKAGGKGVATGPFAENALRAKQALDSFGLDTSWIKQGLPESEVVSKMNAQLASASAKAMTGRPTQFEFAAWMKNNPGLLTSKEGTTALINILRQSAQQDIDLGKLAQNKGNWEKWGDVTDKYYRDHQLISPFTGKPMAEGAVPAREAGAKAAPVGGAAAAANGSWTDPKTGKTYQVINGELHQ